jgi:hypothetical protein
MQIHKDPKRLFSSLKVDVFDWKSCVDEFLVESLEGTSEIKKIAFLSPSKKTIKPPNSARDLKDPG